VPPALICGLPEEMDIGICFLGNMRRKILDLKLGIRSAKQGDLFPNGGLCECGESKILTHFFMGVA
jgi:hypothetical protein